MLVPLLAVSALTLAASPDPLAGLRAEAEALVLIQQTLQWYTATVGETSIQAETYLGHDRLFSKESIARVRKAAQAPGITADERRAREFFQAYLAGSSSPSRRRSSTTAPRTPRCRPRCVCPG